MDHRSDETKASGGRDRDAQLRARLGLHRAPLDRFTVRLATTADQLEDAFTLLHTAYIGRGLQQPDGKNMRITPQHVLQESLVFVAYLGEEPVATTTVTGDSPAGLPLDAVYRDEMAEVRAQATGVVEYGSLAVSKPHRGSGVMALTSMACHFAAQHVFEASHAVIGVNPTAEAHYRALYGFERMGGPAEYGELEGAPVVGLVHEVSPIRARLREHWPEPMADGHFVHERFCDALPPCVQLPEGVAPRDMLSLRLPRRGFQRLFMQRSDRVYSLDSVTRRYLETQRTPATLRAQDSLLQP